MKHLRRLLFTLAGFIITYLLAAIVWATAVTDELAKQIPSTKTKLLTPAQTAILLAVEDPTFFDHMGLDLSPGQGLTTITSSTAREVFLYRLQLSGVEGALQRFYRAVFACCKKVDLGRDMFALTLNRHMTKQDQLNLFTSISYMGSADGKAIWGLAAAAQAYFDKPLAELEQKQFVSLVAMLQSPNQYHPINHPDALSERVARIQKLLQGQCKAQGLLDTHYPDCAARS